MSAVELDRREFCAALAASLAGSAACARTPSEPARTTLIRTLGLTKSQERWIDVLSPAQQEQLREGLTSPRPESARDTTDLLMKVIGRRDRLFAYVGYPPLEQTGACDGLIRE